MELSGIALVVVNDAGSGNAGAASYGGAMGTGPQGQHWQRQGAKHCWGIAEPAPCPSWEHRLGEGALAGSGEHPAWGS